MKNLRIFAFINYTNLMNMKMKVLKISWMLVVILTCNLFFVSCFSEDNPVSEKQQSEAVFQKQLDEALIWAQVYGPSTQAVAEAVALRHNGKATPINYKTRQSAERKCRTDNSKPFELKDLARTTVLCEYDSIRVVIDDIKSAATGYDAFGRHKHQTSDYGYWGDIVNLAFDYLQTEIQVKSYRMYYAVNPKDICQPVLGDSLYNVIHTETGLEPGLAHHYYEIMRADTASAATRERYRKLSIEYLSHFDKDYVK
jgi:hypothetical protein